MFFDTFGVYFEESIGLDIFQEVAHIEGAVVYLNLLTIGLPEIQNGMHGKVVDRILEDLTRVVVAPVVDLPQIAVQLFEHLRINIPHFDFIDDYLEIAFLGVGELEKARKTDPKPRAHGGKNDGR